MTDFLQDEAGGGALLLVAAAAALVWANLAPGAYADLWGTELSVGVGAAALELDLRHWINDGLMAVFFFVVGLEIKRELVVGELREPRAAALPVLAALGGVLAPALIYLALTAGTPHTAGWAIPAATDIAFAVGVLTLLGDRVSAGMKLLLLTIAIVDDVVAIALIALVYSDGVSVGWLAAALAGVGAVTALRAVGVTRIAPYAVVALALWIAVHESGLHATLAGVVLGLLTPTGRVGGRDLVRRLEHGLHPVSAYAIVPLFALANAGVDLGGGVLADAASSRLAWAIAAGLVVGKLVGITGAAVAAVRAGWGVLPPGVGAPQLRGLAALGGIGFTVSLFIAGLAFDDPRTTDLAKIGIFGGSLAAGALGAALLRRAAPPAPGPSGTPTPPASAAPGGSGT